MASPATSTARPQVHGHIVVGQRDGTTQGGHLRRGDARLILIVTLQETHHDD